MNAAPEVSTGTVTTRVSLAGVSTLSDGLRRQVGEVAATIEAEARVRPVIVVFGLGSFGDVLQVTPLLRALKQKFPGAALVLVHHDLLSAKLLEAAPYLTRFIRLRAGSHYLLRNRLKNAGVDLIVECRYVVKYTLGVRPRLGDAGIEFVEAAQNVQKSWLGFVQRFPFDNDALWRAAKTKGWSMYDLMAHTAGFASEDFENLHIELPAPAPGLEKFLLPADYIVVSNSAEWLTLQSALWTKSLPHRKMREVLAQLKEREIATVILGTKNDPGDYPVDYDLRGKTNLIEAAHIVKNAALLLGPEGGLVNLAKAVGTPAVVFFGSTPIEFFGMKANTNIAPRVCGGCWWSTESYLRQCPLLEKTPPCTDSLNVAQIVEAVERLMPACV